MLPSFVGFGGISIAKEAHTKTTRYIFRYLLVVAMPLLISGSNAGAQPVTKGRETFDGLRGMALRTTPADLNIRLDGTQLTAHGILMETGYTGAVVTLVAFTSGDASLYLSNGGGAIGAGRHANVQTAVAQFMTTAQQFLDQMERTTEFPLPETGMTRFYVLTNRGPYSSQDLLEDDLGNGRSELSELFFAGHEVISQIRLSTQGTP